MQGKYRKYFFASAYVLCVLMLTACGGSGGSNTEIGPDVPGRWDMSLNELQSELTNNGITFDVVNEAGETHIKSTPGRDAQSKFVYIIKNGQLSQVVYSSFDYNAGISDFTESLKMAETQIMMHFGNKTEIMTKDLASNQNRKHIKSFFNNNGRMVLLTVSWDGNTILHVSEQFFNPALKDGKELWSYFEKNDPGFIKK